LNRRATDGDLVRLHAERGARMRKHLLPVARDAFARTDLQRLRVHHDVVGRFDLDVARALDLHRLRSGIEHDLVLLRLVDDDDLLRAVLVIEDDPVTGA
jgi:hypothetical protein